MGFVFAFKSLIQEKTHLEHILISLENLQCHHVGYPRQYHQWKPWPAFYKSTKDKNLLFREKVSRKTLWEIVSLQRGKVTVGKEGKKCFSKLEFQFSLHEKREFSSFAVKIQIWMNYIEIHTTVYRITEFLRLTLFKIWEMGNWIWEFSIIFWRKCELYSSFCA